MDKWMEARNTALLAGYTDENIQTVQGVEYVEYFVLEQRYLMSKAEFDLKQALLQYVSDENTRRVLSSLAHEYARVYANEFISA